MSELGTPLAMKARAFMVTSLELAAFSVEAPLQNPMRLQPLKIAIILLALALHLGQSAADEARPSAAAIARACGGCHGAKGQGHGDIPTIKGIPEAEFLRRMRGFRDGQRRATVMDRIAKGYKDEDLAAVAKYFSH